MYTIGKIVISALIIGLVTEFARRFPTYGGIVAALPLVSLLSIIWLSVQGESEATLSKFLVGVIVGLPATIVLLVIVYIAMKNSIHLFYAISMGVVGWGLFLVVQDFVVKLVKEIV